MPRSVSAQNVYSAILKELEETKRTKFDKAPQEEKEFNSFWTSLILQSFINAAKHFNVNTVFPDSVDFLSNVQKKEQKGHEYILDVAWTRYDDSVDHYSTKLFNQGKTGIIAAFECEWGTQKVYHDGWRGILNVDDINLIMEDFSKLADVKSLVKVMAFAIRTIYPPKGGDNWEYMLDLMRSQIRATYRLFPVSEEYLILGWQYGNTEEFMPHKHEIIVVP